eukprot:CAMPEP_0175125376 /NCGR_PEP_ID=MMETSP0087-20121206/3283_1 /TAXON_ID=136419 /ORGANISM="Unknown Unknown, Strain D1" /LENGTH=433 /DNA_ID=CAMNT_0016407209 /DNA_START=1 /DNA_END=1300 /DNA_ORIENTATION=+
MMARKSKDSKNKLVGVGSGKGVGKRGLKNPLTGEPVCAPSSESSSRPSNFSGSGSVASRMSGGAPECFGDDRRGKGDKSNKDIKGNQEALDSFMSSMTVPRHGGPSTSELSRQLSATSSNQRKNSNGAGINENINPNPPKAGRRDSRNSFAATVGAAITTNVPGKTRPRSRPGSEGGSRKSSLTGPPVQEFAAVGTDTDFGHKDIGGPAIGLDKDRDVSLPTGKLAKSGNVGFDNQEPPDVLDALEARLGESVRGTAPIGAEPSHAGNSNLSGLLYTEKRLEERRRAAEQKRKEAEEAEARALAEQQRLDKQRREAYLKKRAQEKAAAAQKAAEEEEERKRKELERQEKLAAKKEANRLKKEQEELERAKREAERQARGEEEDEWLKMIEDQIAEDDRADSERARIQREKDIERDKLVAEMMGENTNPVFIES